MKNETPAAIIQRAPITVEQERKTERLQWEASARADMPDNIAAMQEILSDWDAKRKRRKEGRE